MKVQRTPWWVFGIIAGLALIPPLQHAWVWYFPPEGYVPTGMLTGDNGHHILSMRAFANGFYSPFVTADLNPYSWRYFATPFFLLYGVIGELGRMLGIHEFLWLGLAEGICGAIYLWCAWRFLRVAAPDLARPAFALFTLGGGIGGIVYLACLIVGATEPLLFERAFFRFAQYGLVEGQYLSPLLHFYRIYYTVPLAFGLSALTALIEAQRMRCRQHLFFACFLAFFCGLIQLRIGVMVAFISLLIWESGSREEFTRRFRQGLVVVVATALGCAFGALILFEHPSYRGNVAEVTRGGVQFIPLVYAMLPMLPALAPLLARAWKVDSYTYMARAWLASLAVVGLVTLVHLAWHGSWLYGGDAAAAVIAGRWAYLPLGIWFVMSWWKGSKAVFSSAREMPIPENHFAGIPAWIPVWLLIFVWLGLTSSDTLSLLAPQRLMVLTGLPLAIVVAGGLALLPPRWSRLAFAATLACGVTSIVVGALFFQGPLRLTMHDDSKGPRPFGYLDYALIPLEDTKLMERIGPGRVLPPPWSPVAYSEVLSLQPDAQVLGGPGAMNLGNANFAELDSEIRRFFNPDTPPEWRRDFLARYEVRYVYFPHAGEQFTEVREALKPNLEIAGAEGRGLLLAVPEF